MPHNKHPKLERVSTTPWAREAFGFYGAPCGEIKALAARLAPHLSAYATVYVDANHEALDNPEFCNRLAPEFSAELTNEQGQFRLAAGMHDAPFTTDDKRPDTFDLMGISNRYDLAVVNGNHYLAPHHILIWMPERVAKVRKRMAHVESTFLVLGAEAHELPEDLRNALPNDCIFEKNGLSDTDAIIRPVRAKFKAPEIVGLALAGGQSSRMGHDKTRIDYHGIPQYRHVYDLLDSLTGSAYLSERETGQFNDIANRIADRLVGMGPFGGIISAFMHNPNAAWLVVATDLPLVDRALLEALIAQRDPSKVATAFMNPETGFPDPLITLWEPKAYPRLLGAMAMGHSCPRKVLINSDTKIITPPDAGKLANVNTPEELQRFKS